MSPELMIISQENPDFHLWGEVCDALDQPVLQFRGATHKPSNGKCVQTEYNREEE